MTESQLTLLIKKYLSGEANEEERAQIEQWYESFDASRIEFAEGNAEAMNESTIRSLEAIKEKIEQQQRESTQEMRLLKPEQKPHHWWRVAAAAAIFILLSGGAYFLLNNKQFNKEQANVVVPPVKKDFKPGGNKAVLTLGNGQKIILDSMNKGLLSMQGNTKVIKLNNGQLAYNTEQKAKSKKQKALYNTITTPRGGQYEIVLPDGSKVWLNAASSLRFPTVFVGKKREVEMTGEAYFEISSLSPKGKLKMPFIVKVNGMEVQVLGTHFNVNAYDDETTTKTTLLKGAVKVIKGNSTLLLKPGQEARVKQNGQMQLVKDANVNEAIAWKNNLFWFENDDIYSVMRQLSRWYDVDIKIQGNIPDLFTGSIPRNLTFSKVFEVLQKTGSIHYKIENNKTIIVTL